MNYLTYKQWCKKHELLFSKLVAVYLIISFSSVMLGLYKLTILLVIVWMVYFGSMEVLWLLNRKKEEQI